MVQDGKDGSNDANDPDRRIFLERYGDVPDFEMAYRVFKEGWESMNDLDRHNHEVLWRKVGYIEGPLTRFEYLKTRFEQQVSPPPADIYDGLPEEMHKTAEKLYHDRTGKKFIKVNSILGNLRHLGVQID